MSLRPAPYTRDSLNTQQIEGLQAPKGIGVLPDTLHNRLQERAVLICARLLSHLNSGSVHCVPTLHLRYLSLDADIA